MFNLFQVPEHIPQFASLQTELASLAFNWIVILMNIYQSKRNKRLLKSGWQDNFCASMFVRF